MFRETLRNMETFFGFPGDPDDTPLRMDVTSLHTEKW
jgi:hypothetical protein